jgi:hypothetical protein
MKQQFIVFVIRWVLNSFGLWVAVKIFGTGYSDADLTEGFWVFLLEGCIVITRARITYEVLERGAGGVGIKFGKLHSE